MRGDEIRKSDFSWVFLTEDVLTVNNQISEILIWGLFFFCKVLSVQKVHNN